MTESTSESSRNVKVFRIETRLAIRALQTNEEFKRALISELQQNLHRSKHVFNIKEFNVTFQSPKDNIPKQIVLKLIKRPRENSRGVTYDVVSSQGGDSGNFGIGKILIGKITPIFDKEFCKIKSIKIVARRDPNEKERQISQEKEAKSLYHKQTSTSSTIDKVKNELKYLKIMFKGVKTKPLNYMQPGQGDLLMPQISGQPADEVNFYKSENSTEELLYQQLRFARAALRALELVHRKQIFHGDVKLENLLYCVETGKAILVDFGCATKFNQPTTIDGTPSFIAPEMFVSFDTKGNMTDNGFTVSAPPSADIYGLMLTIAVKFLKNKNNFYEELGEFYAIKNRLGDHNIFDKVMKQLKFTSDMFMTSDFQELLATNINLTIENNPHQRPEFSPTKAFFNILFLKVSLQNISTLLQDKISDELNTSLSKLTQNIINPTMQVDETPKYQKYYSEALDVVEAIESLEILHDNSDLAKKIKSLITNITSQPGLSEIINFDSLEEIYYKLENIIKNQLLDLIYSERNNDNLVYQGIAKEFIKILRQNELEGNFQQRITNLYEAFTHLNLNDANPPELSSLHTLGLMHIHSKFDKLNKALPLSSQLNAKEKLEYRLKNLDASKITEDQYLIEHIKKIMPVFEEIKKNKSLNNSAGDIISEIDNLLNLKEHQKIFELSKIEERYYRTTAELTHRLENIKNNRWCNKRIQQAAMAILDVINEKTPHIEDKYSKLYFTLLSQEQWLDNYSSVHFIFGNIRRAINYGLLNLESPFNRKQGQDAYCDQAVNRAIYLDKILHYQQIFNDTCQIFANKPKNNSQKSQVENIRNEVNTLIDSSNDTPGSYSDKINILYNYLVNIRQGQTSQDNKFKLGYSVHFFKNKPTPLTQLVNEFIDHTEILAKQMHVTLKVENLAENLNTKSKLQIQPHHLQLD